MAKEIDNLLADNLHSKLGEDLWLVKGKRLVRKGRKWFVDEVQIGSFLAAVRHVVKGDDDAVGETAEKS